MDFKTEKDLKQQEGYVRDKKANNEFPELLK